MRISDNAMQITPSPTRKLFDMASKYNDTIDLTLGDPDIKTPLEIRSAACDAIMEGKTRYSANAGLYDLRCAVSNNIEKRNHIHYDPKKEIAITVGAMEALYVSLLCLLNPGDEVVIFEPYWINYKQMVSMCSGVPIVVNKPADSFQIDIDAFKAAITNKTRAVIINSPNNPSGAVYDRKTIEALAEIAKQYDLTVITDEVYRSLIYDGVEYTSILDIEGMKDRTVLIYSFSKEFSMTGWRIGYAAGPEELIGAITRMQENIVACAPLPSQYAVKAALENECFSTEYILEEFSKRRKCIIEAMKDIPMLEMDTPEGTFYAFINIEKTGMNSEEFAYALLEKEHVAVVPGIAYGICGEKYIRVAFTLDENKLKEGFDRIKRFVGGISNK